MKKLAAIVLAIFLYPFALSALAIFIFDDHKPSFLIIGLICLAIPSFAIYSIFVKPRKAKQADNLASRRFSHHLQTVLSELENTEIADIKGVSPEAFNYRPLRGETLLKVQDNVSRIELKSTGNYTSRGTSFSIPIFKGLRYRIGGGTIALQKQQMVTAQGRLIVTTSALAFEGNDKSERINWSQIADVEIFQDGIKIQRRTGPARIYSIFNFNPAFAAIITRLLQEA